MSIFHGKRRQPEEIGGSFLRLSDDEIERRRSTLPAEPCFKCGDRGWCRHRIDTDTK